MRMRARGRAGVRGRYAASAPATSAGIVVEHASGLDAKPPLIDVLAQQPTGAFRNAFAHGGVVLLDCEHHVEADAVHEAKRRHAGAGPYLPNGVDVLGRRHTLLDDHEALALDRRPDAVEDEPVALAPHPEGHEAVAGELLHERVDDPFVGLAARHELDRVELGRLPVVGVQHALGVLDLGDHLAGGSSVFDVFEYRLAYELPGALVVQPQRLLQRDPEESEALQLPRAL